MSKTNDDFYFINNTTAGDILDVLSYMPYSAMEVFKKFKKEKNRPGWQFLTDLTAFEIRQVMTNGDYTTVMWEDGSHTVVKRKADEPDNFEVAILYAMLKKYCGGSGSAMTRYFQDAKEKTFVKGAKKGKKLDV